MQPKTIAIAVYILSILLLGLSCLLDNTISFFVTTETGKVWLRFFTRTYFSITFIGYGLAAIIIPENWLEKNVPLYRPNGIVSKVVAGTVGIVVGVMGVLLNIWVLMQFLEYF